MNKRENGGHNISDCRYCMHGCATTYIGMEQKKSYKETLTDTDRNVTLQNVMFHYTMSRGGT